MKKLILAVIAMIMTLGANAQSFDTSRLGLRLSIDAAMPGDLSTGDGYTSMSIFGNGPGFSLGAVYKFDIADRFYIEPGLSFYYDAMSINKHFLSDLVDESFISGASGDFKLTSRSLRKFGLRIPVMVGYSFPLEDEFTFQVFTGPMFDIGLSADMYYGIKVDGYDIHKAQSLYGANRTLNRFDCYWNIGAGLTFSEHYSLMLQCDLGMCNIAKKQNSLKPSMHETLVQLTFGYNF